jgi:hypothetical protein
MDIQTTEDTLNSPSVRFNQRVVLPYHAYGAAVSPSVAYSSVRLSISVQDLLSPSLSLASNASSSEIVRTETEDNTAIFFEQRCRCLPARKKPAFMWQHMYKNVSRKHCLPTHTQQASGLTRPIKSPEHYRNHGRTVQATVHQLALPYSDFH